MTNYIGSKQKLQQLLQRNAFHIKKNFGQNFLIDQNILAKIVRVAGVSASDTVIEIGPGVGALTQFLAEVAKYVYCFEIDLTLKALLAETLADTANTEVLFQDFLKVDTTAWLKTIPHEAQQSIKVVANLPYYITTPILEKLIDWYVVGGAPLRSATVMMQKEVAERLVAQPHSKAYGSLSIFIQLFTQPVIAFSVPKTVFIPVPRVDSAIVNLQFQPSPYFTDYHKAQAFMTFVRCCFATRRKTLVNNLSRNYEKAQIIDVLQILEINERVRAEQLAIPQFLQIFQALSEKN